MRMMNAAMKPIVYEHFGVALTADVSCWIVSGAHPERLVTLLETGSTYGTEVIWRARPPGRRRPLREDIGPALQRGRGCEPLAGARLPPVVPRVLRGRQCGEEEARVETLRVPDGRDPVRKIHQSARREVDAAPRAHAG